MKYMIIVLALLFSTGLNAKIDIANVFPSTTDTSCDGVVIIELTDEPIFNIVIQGQEESLLENVGGLVTFDNLCAGSYSFLVTMKDFPACEKVLMTTVGYQQSDFTGGGTQTLVDNANSEESIELVPFDQQRAAEWIDVQIIPNPNKGRFRIKCADGPLEHTYIEVYSVRGALVYKDELVQRQTKVNLSDLSAGVYYVAFFNKGQLIRTLEVVIGS